LRGTVQYELRLEEPTTGQIWDQIVSGVMFGGGRTRQVWDSVKATAWPDATTADRPDLAAFSYVEDLDLLLQVFPHDLRLPALAMLLAGPLPALVPLILADLGAGAWQVTGWDAETVQYRVDMRAIVRLDVEATDAASGRSVTRQFYAKVYRDAEEARRSHRGQDAIAQAIGVADSLLIVAQPVAFLEGLNTVVTTAAPGTSLSKIIKRGDGVDQAARAAARAVAAFHQLDANAPPRPIAEDVARLREAEGLLSSTYPGLAADVSAIVEAVVAGLADAPSALIHGDLKPDHILVDGEQVALIDFDLIGGADPMIDVAHLLAFLGKAQERARSPHEADGGAADLFVAEYFAHVPDAWRERLPLYHAMTSIHKAAGLSRRRGANAQNQIKRVLREGQSLLAGEGGAAAMPTFRRRLTRPTLD
jgi:aminoglycoside phosphotransferase (APT) family kinase protein